MKIEIIVPYTYNEYEDTFGDTPMVLKELKSLSGKIDFIIHGTSINFITIAAPKKDDSKISELFRDHLFYSSFDLYLKFTIKIDLKKVKNLDDTEFDVPILYKQFIRRLLIYFNLAAPGAFYTQQGYVTTTNKEKKETEKFSAIVSLIPESLHLLDSLKWPTVKRISLLEFYPWIRKYNKALQGISTTKIERALNCFSYLFHHSFAEQSASDLFYSLMAVETFYADKSDSIMKQVDRKSQIVLGSRSESKNIFKQMYDFRSRYIHGDLDLPNAEYDYITEESEKEIYGPHMDPLSKHTGLAMFMLIATIQKLYELKKEDFIFDYHLVS